MAKKTMKKSRVGFISKEESIKTTWHELILDESSFVEYKSTITENGFTPRKVRVTITLTVEDVK